MALKRKSWHSLIDHFHQTVGNVLCFACTPKWTWMIMKDKANGLSKSGQDGLPSNVVCKRMARREWREDTSRPVPSPMGEHVHDHGVGSGLPTGWLAQQMLACSPTPRSSVPSYKQLCVHIRTKLMIMTPVPALRKLLYSTQSGCPPPAEGGQKR